MVLRFLLLEFAVLSILTLTSQEPQHEPIAPYENEEAYSVYDAVLFTGASATSPRVISADTESASMCLKPEGEWKRVLTPAIADYQQENEKTYRLQPKFGMNRKYELLTKQEIYARFKRPGEGGWVELSAVGFNRTRTVAVLWVNRGCPGLCGSGTFHVLRKKDGKWRPLEWKGTSCAVAS